MKQFILSLLLGLFSINICLADVWSGSAFFINNQGYLATAGHVVHDAKDLKVLYKNKWYRATLVAADYDNDIAIIKINVKNNIYFRCTLDIKAGDKIYLMGYPFPNQFGYNLKIQTGYITHINDEINMNLFSCGGNSGGVIVNTGNQFVGVLVSGVNISPTIRCSWASQAKRALYVYNLAARNHVYLILNYKVDIEFSKAQIKSSSILGDSVVYIEGNN